MATSSSLLVSTLFLHSPPSSSRFPPISHGSFFTPSPRSISLHPTRSKRILSKLPLDDSENDNTLLLPRLSAVKPFLLLCTSVALSFSLFAASPAVESAAAFVVSTPRKLQTDELATVRLFQENTPSVVYITNLAVRQDAFTLDVLEVPQGSGSGFVWDKQGHIVTNYHVIRGASDLRVTLADQSTYDAKVVGFDQDKDVAVLRIEFIASFYQHVVVQRRVKNPFEEDEVVGITNYIDLGFELQTRVDDSKASDNLPDSSLQMAASWQANKNFLLKGKVGALSSTFTLAFKSWWKPSFAFNISATTNHSTRKTAYGFGLRVDSIREASYQRADPNFVMLTPNKEHLADGIVWKMGKRPMFQSDLDAENFSELPKELRPPQKIL